MFLMSMVVITVSLYAMSIPESSILISLASTQIFPNRSSSGVASVIPIMHTYKNGHVSRRIFFVTSAMCSLNSWVNKLIFLSFADLGRSRIRWFAIFVALDANKVHVIYLIKNFVYCPLCFSKHLVQTGEACQKTSFWTIEVLKIS